MAIECVMMTQITCNRAYRNSFPGLLQLKHRADSDLNADDMEQSMLSMTPESEAGSRLSCQVELSESLNGIRVTLPEFQM